MANDLHLHIRDHMNDCIRGILDAVASDLRDRTGVLEKDARYSNAIQVLLETATDMEELAKQFS